MAEYNVMLHNVEEYLNRLLEEGYDPRGLVRERENVSFKELANSINKFDVFIRKQFMLSKKKLRKAVKKSKPFGCKQMTVLADNGSFAIDLAGKSQKLRIAFGIDGDDVFIQDAYRIAEEGQGAEIALDRAWKEIADIKEAIRCAFIFEEMKNAHRALLAQNPVESEFADSVWVAVEAGVMKMLVNLGEGADIEVAVSKHYYPKKGYRFICNSYNLQKMMEKHLDFFLASNYVQVDSLNSFIRTIVRAGRQRKFVISEEEIFSYLVD